MVLLADPREELEGRAAVPVPVLHADLGEDPGHGVGPDTSIQGRDRPLAALGRPGLGVVRPASAGQQPGSGQLLDAHREAAVDLSRLHRHRCDPQRGGAGGAGIGHVVDGDPGLSDLLLEHLADPPGPSHEVPGPHHADVLHRHAAVSQCAHHGLGGQVQGVLVRVLAELGHVDAQYPDVLAHRIPLGSGLSRPARIRN